VTAPPAERDLMTQAEMCVRQAAALREAVAAGDLGQAYACADWLRDVARDVRHELREHRPTWLDEQRAARS